MSQTKPPNLQWIIDIKFAFIISCWALFLEINSLDNFSFRKKTFYFSKSLVVQIFPASLWGMMSWDTWRNFVLVNVHLLSMWILEPMYFPNVTIYPTIDNSWCFIVKTKTWSCIFLFDLSFPCTVTCQSNDL